MKSGTRLFHKPIFAVGVVSGLMAAFSLLLTAFSGGAAASTDAPAPVPVRAGLMWNHSGLPAVFPLQVKTVSGQNYYLILTDVMTGKPALAAFIIGGSFFKVLVPPGTYAMRIAYGKVWQGEDLLFGPGNLTRILKVQEPLTFKVRGPGTKAGHLVALGTDAQGRLVVATIKGQFICQSLETKYHPLWQGIYQQEYWPRYGRLDRDAMPAYRFGRIETAPPQDRRNRYLYQRDFTGYGILPKYTYSVRSRYCR